MSEHPLPRPFRFMTPGRVTVTTVAVSERAAREQLWDETGSTLDTDPVLTFGKIGITALDLEAAAAELDDPENLYPFPETDFTVAAAARAAARALGQDWKATGSVWGNTGTLENRAAGARYALEPRGDVLQLRHAAWPEARAEFEQAHHLGELAASIASAVLRSISVDVTPPVPAVPDDDITPSTIGQAAGRLLGDGWEVDESNYGSLVFLSNDGIAEATYSIEARDEYIVLEHNDGTDLEVDLRTGTLPELAKRVAAAIRADLDAEH